MVWSMIALSETSPARESCDQTKRQTIFGLHSQAENGLDGRRPDHAFDPRFRLSRFAL